MTPAWASSATPHLLHLYECIFAIPQLLYLICYTSLSATSHLICYIALYWPLLLQPQLHPTLYWPHLLQPHLPHGFIPWGITPACLHLPQAACLHLPACTMSPHLTYSCKQAPPPRCGSRPTLPPHLPSPVMHARHRMTILAHVSTSICYGRLGRHPEALRGFRQALTWQVG